ncbi:hypothetical protein FGO68_gene7996 [Halteria grandinella]|uniref:Uncharacterized protein n=1 Tax=Halteria grandinella TaxID=5974 RepID=A0A8J8P4M9_HALGN|nr:hypothetical protein FGO68_gene7996 [Halteria grandinella]
MHRHYSNRAEFQEDSKFDNENREKAIYQNKQANYPDKRFLTPDLVQGCQSYSIKSIFKSGAAQDKISDEEVSWNQPMCPELLRNVSFQSQPRAPTDLLASPHFGIQPNLPAYQYSRFRANSSVQNRHEYDVRDSAKVQVEFSLESKEEFAKYLKLLFDDLLARDFKSNETDMQIRQAGKN